MLSLRPYQETGINRLAQKFVKGLKRVVFQLATGGGKTVTFAAITNRYLIKSQKKVLILVHREELLQQAYKTLYRWYEIVAVPVTANSTYLANSMVYVAMVETAFNRLKKNKNYFGNIGMVIVDECHLGNFKKLYSYFPDQLIIGFTATNISASKRDPLKNHFQDIVACVDIPELIEIWRQDHNSGLVPNKTYHVQNVDRKQLKLASTGEFDERQMGDVYSGTKHVQNCLKAYQKYADHTKAIIFNCNIEHSKKVNEAFQSAGYPCRHLDGEMSDAERKATIQWFRSTPGAILNNVGVLTAGFDEPTIITVVVNCSTMSLTKWLQMTGRGSRPLGELKQWFNIIDMGGNAYEHLDWSEPRDWADIFFNPERPKGGGEAPMKECRGCGVLIHLSTKKCKWCGADNSPRVVYDGAPVSVSELNKRKPPFIDVPYLIKENANKRTADGKPYKPMVVLHEIKRQLVGHARRSWKLKRIDAATAELLVRMYHAKVKEWCLCSGKNFDWWMESTTAKWMYEEFRRVWKYEPSKQIV